jgi:AraC-like DNA-binding protein
MGMNPLNQSRVRSTKLKPRASIGLRIVPPDALGVATRLAARALREAGIILDPLLSKAKLSVDQIGNEDMRIPVESQIIFLGLAAKALNEPLLGFRLACGADLREMGLLHYAAGAAATLGEALRRFERYSSIINEGVTLRCVESEGLAIELGYAGVARHSDQQQMEFLATALIRSFRTLTGSKLKPTTVDFVHQSSKEQAAELSKYFGCKIIFGAETDRIFFDKSARQLALIGTDPYLSHILLDYCEQTLANRRSNACSLRTKIENAITPLLPHGDASFNEIARKLGIGRRTLARRLKAEGLSFGEILKQLRADLIARYLGENRLSISQVAWLVGFRSVAAFSHSCKRSNGMSPKALREKLLKG